MVVLHGCKERSRIKEAQATFVDSLEISLRTLGTRSNVTVKQPRQINSTQRHIN